MREIYDWVPWFRELVGRIADEGEAYLNEKARQVDWGENLARLEYGDEGIDPFSFVYFVASKAATKQLKTVYDSVSQEFGIESPLPDPSVDDYYIFPTPPGLKVLFRDGKNSNNDLLWRLFRQAIEDGPGIDPDDFKEVLSIRDVAVPKLTQSLFLLNPGNFLPVDITSADLSEALDLPTASDIKIGGYATYRTFLEKATNAFPGCQPYEINMFLYMQKSGSIVISDNFYQVSTQVMGHNEGDYWDDGEEKFNDNYWVYTGGAGDEKPYPLTDPKQGDVILVRTGRIKGKAIGRAIGVVYQNDYVPDGWNQKRRIHVLWISKSEGILAENTTILGFSKAGTKTREAFERTKNYRPSFELIGKLKKSSIVIETDSVPESQQPQADPKKNRHPLNQILYGPPGTSKTWHTVSHALAIIDNETVNQLEMERKEEREDKMRQFSKLKADGQIEMVTFHQNYNYEDFIEGIRPVLREHADEDGNLDYVLSRGIFRRIAESARIHSKSKYVLIIDEINRGNIAKIFGELITVIEDSKRTGGDDAATVTLPYSKEDFGVPNNLYIIGTMNTADRSIALLDTALRRRFHFVEMMPDPKLVPEDIHGVNCQKLLEAMNNRIRFLLDREHQIGHTYLMNVKSIDSLASTFKNKIVPLLQEYFYDNWEKIELVLKRNGFIEKREIPEELQAEDQLIDVEQKVYEVLPDGDDKWRDPESYRAIYRSAAGDTDQAS